MLIAFKTFSDCPEAKRPLGIPLHLPWIEQECEESARASMIAKGYLVLSLEDYAQYKADREPEYIEWTTWAAQNIPLENVKNMILTPARMFGISVVDEFGAENVLLGITQAGMTNQVRKATAQVVAALSTGSLYDAIYECRQIPEDKKDPLFVSDARLLAFINKIETYLNIPLSTSI